MGLTAATLFSGIGGADLGLQRAGYTLLWQCERDPARQSILQRRFPGVRGYAEAETLPADALAPDLLFIDPPTRQPADFAPAWPAIAMLRPDRLVIQATSEGHDVVAPTLAALGYTSLVFGLDQEIARLGTFAVCKQQPFVLALRRAVTPEALQVELQAAIRSVPVAEAEAEGWDVIPASMVEIVEALSGFPRRWTCRCDHPVPMACHETTERLIALNAATDPALAYVIGRAMQALEAGVAVAA